MKTIRTILFIAIIANSLALLGQKEYNIWYFGDKAGYDFNQGSPPKVLTNSPMNTNEASSGICDKSGNLLFYTNGDTIYNRKHSVMKNGGFSPYYATESSVQGVMVLPVAGSNSLYHVFTNATNPIPPIAQSPWIRHSIVDITGDNGYGEVVTSRTPILPNSSEGMAFALHSNERDYWIGAADKNKGEINFVRTRNATIDTKIVRNKFSHNANPSSIFLLNPYHFTKFSPDSKLFVFTSFYDDVNKNNLLGLFKFDNTTGTLSNRILLPLDRSTLKFGEFSPCSRYLYIADYLWFPFPSKIVIKQYDLSVWDSASILNSMKIVLSIPVQGFSYYGSAIRGMQLAPDGKIYFFHTQSDSASVINYPDSSGSKCGIDYKAIKLPHKHPVGGPYYPNFWFRKRINRKISFCKGDSALLINNYPSSAKVKWNNGDTTVGIIVKNSGVYISTTDFQNSKYYDTFYVTVKKPFVVYLGNDTAFCEKFQHLLDAGTGAESYLWNTGDTTVTKLVDMPGIYSVTIKDSNSCENGDTIQIDQVHLPSITATEYCDSVNLSITPQSPSIKYLWNTGDTSTSVTLYNSGKYSVSASSQFCSITDSIRIRVPTTPKVELGPDITFCEAFSIILEVKDSGEYYWNTGATTPSINVIESGIYSIRVKRGNCEASDSITISCNMWYFIPNAFTPNGDNTNNTFYVEGDNIIEIDLKIFNRWGELLYQSSSIRSSWDGNYKGEPCPDGVYIYLASIRGWRKGMLVKENVSGNVTLMR